MLRGLRVVGCFVDGTPPALARHAPVQGVAVETASPSAGVATQFPP